VQKILKCKRDFLKQYIRANSWFYILYIKDHCTVQKWKQQCYFAIRSPLSGVVNVRSLMADIVSIWVTIARCCQYMSTMLGVVNIPSTIPDVASIWSPLFRYYVTNSNIRTIFNASIGLWLFVVSTHLFCSETYSAVFVYYEQSASLKASFAWPRFSISRADCLPHDGIHFDTFLVLHFAHRYTWSWHSITSVVLMWMFTGVKKSEEMYHNVVHFQNSLFAILNGVLMLLNVSDEAAGW